MRLPPFVSRSAPARRGAALMLALLVLFVLVAIVFQINIGTGTDARIARNEVAQASMDYAIEGALLEVFEQLKTDGEASAGGAPGMPGMPGAGGPGAAAGGNDLGALMGTGDVGGAGGPGGAPGEGGAPAGPVDSREDEWARPQRTSINEIDLRILIQDEESKYNVLSMLTENPEERRKAFDRVVRILDLCREGTSVDIEPTRARAMTEAMLEHMSNRERSFLPRPRLSTDTTADGQEAPYGLPLSLREFVAIEPFEEDDFRDFRDRDGVVVHSIASFLTVWTALEPRSEAGDVAPTAPQPGGAANANNAGPGGNGGQQGGGGQQQVGEGGAFGAQGSTAAQASQGAGAGAAGGAGSGPAADGLKINVNTAPPVVLKGLFDSREVDPRFWDDVIEYRNLEDEEAMKERRDQEDYEPVYDEFGREVVIRQHFADVATLSELDGWARLEPAMQLEITQLLGVSSQVFSIHVTARKSTAAAGTDEVDPTDARAVREREERGGQLERTVRSVVWRRTGGSDGTALVPIERWEWLSYSPYEVLDFPDEDR